MLAKLDYSQGAEVIDISAVRGMGDNSEAADREYVTVRRQIWSKDLPHQVKIIALAIVEHMWSGNLSCYPSKARLMDMVNMTERAFDTHYKRAKELFIIEQRPGRSSIFHARIEKISRELIAMFPMYGYGEPPADFAPPPPAISATPPPADFTGGTYGTPRRYCGTPPAKNVGNPPQNLPPEEYIRGKEEKEEYPPANAGAPAERRAKKKSAPKVRLSEDWQVDLEWRARTKQKFGITDVQIDKEAARFKRYWTSPDAKNPRKADWWRTWENWIDRALERGISTTHMGQSNWRDEEANQRKKLREALEKVKAEYNG